MGPGQHWRAVKDITVMNIGTKEVKLSLFTNITIVYVGNPKKINHKKNPNLDINKFGKFTGYKANMNNPLYFHILATHS